MPCAGMTKCEITGITTMSAMASKASPLTQRQRMIRRNLKAWPPQQVRLVIILRGAACRSCTKVKGSTLAHRQRLKLVYTFIAGGAQHGVYIGLLALVVNFGVAIIATPMAAVVRRAAPADATQQADFEDASNRQVS